MWHFNLTAVSGCVCQSASTTQAETWCGWSVFYYIFTSHRTGNWTHGLFAQLQLQPSFFIILRQDLPKSLSCPGWAVTWYSSASASGRIKGGHAMPSLVSVLKCVLACVGWMCAYASVVQQCVCLMFLSEEDVMDDCEVYVCSHHSFLSIALQPVPFLKWTLC